MLLHCKLTLNAGLPANWSEGSGHKVDIIPLLCERFTGEHFSEGELNNCVLQAEVLNKHMWSEYLKNLGSHLSGVPDLLFRCDLFDSNRFWFVVFIFICVAQTLQINKQICCEVKLLKRLNFELFRHFIFTYFRRVFSY